MNELINSNQNSIIELKYGENTGLQEFKPFQHDIFLFDTFIAGTSHIDGIEELEPYINPGDKVDFFREPDNPYDPQAILVKNSDGIKIGYVPKNDNPIFARLMDAGKLLYGKIKDKELIENWVKLYIDIYLKD